jgi:hypothetical protein
MPVFPILRLQSNTLEEFLDEQTEKGLRRTLSGNTEEIRARNRLRNGS